MGGRRLQLKNQTTDRSTRIFPKSILLDLPISDLPLYGGRVHRSEKRKKNDEDRDLLVARETVFQPTMTGFLPLDSEEGAQRWWPEGDWLLHFRWLRLWLVAGEESEGRVGGAVEFHRGKWRRRGDRLGLVLVEVVCVFAGWDGDDWAAGLLPAGKNGVRGRKVAGVNGGNGEGEGDKEGGVAAGSWWCDAGERFRRRGEESGEKDGGCGGGDGLSRAKEGKEKRDIEWQQGSGGPTTEREGDLGDGMKRGVRFFVPEFMGEWVRCPAVEENGKERERELG
ncbi:hypothetical protein HAX54_007589 [Datura stramonium]|uniref:Uncharacterized protein n=1 Tax=Datura stramonium TaxID=4076 RepID=A0ABS8RUZ3_DATST|nr:hypothetical protein [Datura stramonium]